MEVLELEQEQESENGSLSLRTKFARTALNHPTVDAESIYNDAKHVIETTLQSDGQAITKIVHIVRVLVQYFVKTRHFSRDMCQDMIIDVIFLVIDEDHGPLDHFDDIIKPIVESAVNEFFDADGMCSRCTWRVFDPRTWFKSKN